MVSVVPLNPDWPITEKTNLRQRAIHHAELEELKRSMKAGTVRRGVAKHERLSVRQIPHILDRARGLTKCHQVNIGIADYRKGVAHTARIENKMSEEPTEEMIGAKAAMLAEWRDENLDVVEDDYPRFEFRPTPFAGEVRI